MENFNTTKLTAAKICHEIANYLSVMKFLQDDIRPSNTPEAIELIKSIDLLSYTMDFFRSVYTGSVQNSNVLGIIKNICRLKNISLIAPTDIMETISGDLTNAIGIVLYIIMKICKPGDKITIKRSSDSFFIEKDNSTTISQNVINAINDNSCEEDIFNILAKYAKESFTSINYKISIETDSMLKVKIWK
ncbi:MAG: hypothetical protein LBU35_00990 [Holosporales bacterium]|jgi:hypothetical protein|nr:hypothetical protein [Holosporales bacterium]